jgi:hypothetical protein
MNELRPKGISFLLQTSHIAAGMNAIELTGMVDAQHQLRLDEPVPIAGPSRVRVIILVPDPGEEIDEKAWIQAAAKSSTFDFLKEAGEDIYTLSDGRPFHDER